MSKKGRENEIDRASSSEDEESSSENDSHENAAGQEVIQADFEGRNCEDCDFHGIRQLLRQLFLKSNVDLGALADLIISQNYIGSVVKQSLDVVMDDDDDDEDDGSDGVFGVTTVINITKRKDEPCIKQIRTLLSTLASENASDDTKAFVNKILSDDTKNIGLIINERILNIPAPISVPLFTSLLTEIEKAIKNGMSYKFEYLMWICKIYKKDDDDSDVLFANQEEQPLVNTAFASFDVDVKEMSDLSQWDYDGGAFTPYRKILIFEGNKLDQIVKLISEEVKNV